MPEFASFCQHCTADADTCVDPAAAELVQKSLMAILQQYRLTQVACIGDDPMQASVAVGLAQELGP